MKYDLWPEKAIIDLKTGFAVNSGWTIIYHFNEITGEYLGANYEYILIGTSLPAHSCLDAPKLTSDTSKAIVRKHDKWEYLTDHRGKIVYSTETGQPLIISEIGEIPIHYTLLKPAKFDKWEGNQWVLDTEKQHQQNVNSAQKEKNERLNEIIQTLSYLQDAIDTNIATQQEKTLLQEYKTYRVLLNRIDVNKAPDIEWPIKPQH